MTKRNALKMLAVALLAGCSKRQTSSIAEATNVSEYGAMTSADSLVVATDFTIALHPETSIELQCGYLTKEVKWKEIFEAL